MKYAMFIPKEQLPAILLEKHKDWIWPFKLIPRRMTSWLGRPPYMKFGNAEENFVYYIKVFPYVWRRSKPVPESVAFLLPKPVPDRGWWFGIPPFLAIRKGRWYFRIGFRWDDIDCYYALSIAFKKY